MWTLAETNFYKLFIGKFQHRPFAPAQRQAAVFHPVACPLPVIMPEMLDEMRDYRTPPLDSGGRRLPFPDVAIEQDHQLAR